MVMGDVDWFKNYNDRNGHEAGNKLLRELAAVLKTSIREEDILCRYGGEEFLFFLSGISSREEALRFTERIRRNIEEFQFANQEFQPNNNLTMSFGLTYFSKNRIKTLDVINKTFLKKLANEADMGMSEAKGKHRTLMGEQVLIKNRVCLYTKEQPKDLPEPPAMTKVPEEAERRKQKRFQTSAVLVYRTNDFYKVTKTIDLSLGGAKIPTDTQFDPNQVFDVILVLGSNACQLQGEVMYSIMAGENYSHYFTGLRFQDMSVKDRKHLMDYFASMNPHRGYLPH
jgi:diguanylate cyclase (GGDEF)-like protein